MIVFWRLILTYYLCAVLFYHLRFFAWRNRHPAVAAGLQGGIFAVVAGLLCSPYLFIDWQFAELYPLPGWAGVLVASVLYALINRLLVYRPGQKYGYTVTFLFHELLAWLSIFICSPLHILYQTGNFMAEPLIIFLIGLIVVTKIFSLFVYAVEMDLYGRDYPTIDESFVTMLMRLIFFLIVLLPGWRWVFWFFVWFYACGEAHQNRLMDFSRFALYFSALGATAVGFLVRYSWYWI